MILYLYGPENYRRQKTLKEKIISPYLEKYPNGVVANFDLADEAALESLKDFTKNQSLFSSVKLGMILNPEEAEPKELKKILLELLEDKKTTVVVVAEKKLAKTFDFLLKDPVKFWEFDKLIGEKFLAFIKNEAQARGLNLNNNQIRDLALVYAGDSWALINELEKISLGFNLEKKEKAPEFFDLIKQMHSQAGISTKVRALFYLLENNDPALVFNMVSAFSGYGKKSLFADYDLAVKSGKLEYGEVLLDFAITTN
jgi:hypothetical protein